MSSLEDRLRRLLDRDAPRGWWSLLRRAPADEGRRLARGREPETIAAARALLASERTPARVRQNAIPLLAVLLPVAAARRPAAGGYFAEVREEMTRHLDDPDPEVALRAAVELLQIATEPELDQLRPQLAPLLPRLRERRDDNPTVRRALTRLGGARDALAWLREIDAARGPLPPDVGELLDALDRQLPPEAALLLPGLFVRLDAIAERRPPRHMALGGVRLWDVDTREAILAFRLFTRGAGAQGIAAAVDLMKSAHPELMPVLLEEVAAEGEQAALLAAAAAEDGALPAAVRERAVSLLGALARAGHDLALAKLRRLREQGELAAAVDRALAPHRATSD